MDKDPRTKAINQAWDKFTKNLLSIQNKLLAIRRSSAEKQNISKLKEIRERMDKI